MAEGSSRPWGWYRVKIGALGPDQLGADLPEWASAIETILIPAIEALEARGEIDRFFFLPEADDPVPHIMLVIHGDVTKVLAELVGRGAPLRHDLKKGDYEDYATNSEDRFGEHHRLGVALFEVGSRFAGISWQRKRACDRQNPIIAALWHAFRIGRLEHDFPVALEEGGQFRDVTKEAKAALRFLAALLGAPRTAR